jgi:hypothetical protein
MMRLADLVKAGERLDKHRVAVELYATWCSRTLTRLIYPPTSSKLAVCTGQRQGRYK